MTIGHQQVTSGEKGHFLNHTQVFSSDGRWLVYDTRNVDSEIGSTGTIEMVNTENGDTCLLYKTDNQTKYGPGVGAVTFSPMADKVMFIHGIKNACEDNPYGFTRRTGVSIDIKKPGQPVFMDARNVEEPYTAGALRGGTHAHSWSGDGKMVCFTYNDYVLEQLQKTDNTVADLRTVGVMFPKAVHVPNSGSGENISGQMFSVLVTNVTDTPKPGSNDINKAFDECWVGVNGYRRADGSWQARAIAFQGNTITTEGKEKTEIFITDLPTELTKAKKGFPLEGGINKRPNCPHGVMQRRLTYLKNGVQGPRHWLRSSPCGSRIYFLSKDDTGFINIFSVSTTDGSVLQITHHKFNVQSGVNLDLHGERLAYVAKNAVFVTEIETETSHQLTTSDNDFPPIGCVMWSPNGDNLVYNRYVLYGEKKYVQIFKIDIIDKS